MMETHSRPETILALTFTLKSTFSALPEKFDFATTQNLQKYNNLSLGVGY